jgi:hypothetical protein
MYDYGSLKSEEEKRVYLYLADVWWFESNKNVPINVFLRQEWAIFRPTLKTFNSKEVDLKMGPNISLKEIAAKRRKRRSITLVRRVI